MDFDFMNFGLIEPNLCHFKQANFFVISQVK